MRSMWVAGLFVAVALLGPGNARAQGLCSELTFFGDSGTTAGCGDTRSHGTLLVEDLNGIPDLDCPGSNCDGDSYTFSDGSDLIRVVLAGMHHDDADDIGMQDCNSDVRWSIVDWWNNLFEDSCTDATCEQAQHLWRTPDDDAATATVLELLGLPAIDAEPFCNGDELEDNDPIRRPCADGEDVCQPSGTLGLVLPIVPGPGSTEPCSLGVFKWKILPFTRFVCPQGINPLFGLCLQPQDAQGNFGCLNPAFNTSFGTPGGVDGRVHNLWALNADGTAPIVDGKELVAAFDRIHTANTIAQGASVCLEPTASARIECLTEASPCSLGTECKDEPQLFACTEQGIRDAIAKGGGPHRFDCPTRGQSHETSGEISIYQDVILDGEQRLTLDGQGTYRVFKVDSGVEAHLTRMNVLQGVVMAVTSAAASSTSVH